MNKASKLLAGMAAVMLCACSSDELQVEVAPEVPAPTFDGDVAFLTVNLKDVGSMMGRSTTSPGYEYGTQDEHAITTANFFFYDENGVYVSKGSIWTGGTENTNKPTENVEFQGNNTIVLENLEGKNHPCYMLTVLNAPKVNGSVEGFEDMIRDAVTIDAAAGLLVDSLAYEANNGGFKTDDGRYIMTTSTYKRSSAAEKYPYATLIPEGAFKKEPHIPTPDFGDVVEVFVERLAAKVRVVPDFDEDLNPSIIVNGETLYRLTATVAGEENDSIGSGAGSSTSVGVAATEVYIKLLKWGLTTTNQKSYLAKHIDLVTDPITGFAWNAENDHRSFWGNSFNWNKTVPFNTVSFGDLNVEVGYGSGKNAYCAENTNAVDFIRAGVSGEAFDRVDASKVTTVLLGAQVCNDKGEYMPIVLYRGVHYLIPSYIAYALNSMANSADGLNFYIKTSAVEGESNSYKRVPAGIMKLIYANDGEAGHSLIAVDEEKLAAWEESIDGGKLYARTVAEDGKVTWTSTTVKDLNDRLAAFNATNKATAAPEGIVYYTIPVEHLNSTAANATTMVEAKYGVVRNHCYEILLNSIKKLGHGVFDPDEDNEILTPDNPGEDPTYYVGACVNVLPWKIVKQTVDL